MNIEIKRTTFTGNSTIGELYIDGVFNCYTLEDVVRPKGVKVDGATAIPDGDYKVTVTYSNRFKKDLPLINDVPNFSGVRIHPGNTAADTEGCILVGTTKGVDSIGNSRQAFAPLFEKIKEACDESGFVTLGIVNVQAV